MVETRSGSHAPSAPAPNSSTRRTGNRRTPSSSKPLPSPPDISSTGSPSPAITTTTSHQPWSHAPTTLTLAWLAISLPLVVWDTGYVLGRPATMPGGWAHAPIWSPYELYGRVDHMYGFKQWNLGNGFTAAQGFLNAIETALYVAYWWTWYRSSPSVAAAAAAAAGGTNNARRRIAGRAAALAVVLGFAASVMTVSKTVLYWLNEYFSGFDNIGHNKPWDLILLWIIPNGAWLIVPSYMIYQLGSEIIDAIVIASEATGSTSTSTSSIKEE
ncbi:hypothetical protein BD289DRAFT_506797 [Coniella lustricola]|uniref:Emopamil binding protein-domain-containing protein n=1 Tax=Coniella lustricola TaxID=2025994 RepID=A0A2T3A5A5_9PEZI|nr:hypothetical protein BD289DRAFT_506797 [Coniella lustricola]